ncbi:unnamed protein product [Linum trigynum]|uniref:Uncharacterized protein n=1 Tax=Linum trigynum TaxID=586398 RepID=A0AAV2DG42_9ROSI
MVKPKVDFGLTMAQPNVDFGLTMAQPKSSFGEGRRGTNGAYLLLRRARTAGERRADGDGWATASAWRRGTAGHWRRAATATADEDSRRRGKGEVGRRVTDGDDPPWSLCGWAMVKPAASD